jgi:A/G-specific adenine glycosylase
MHRCAQHLVNENGGRWPGGFDELIALPGIGPYTASALSSIAFSAPHPAIDGNLERVLTRLFDLQIDPTKSKPLMKKYAYAILNEREPGDHNQALMELGQLTCRPREAHCPTCPISRFCLARARQTVHKNPKPKAPLEMRRIKLRITLVKNGSKYLFIKRPEDSKFLKGISGFLTETKGAKEHVLDGSFDKHTLKRTKGETIGQFQHSITNHQITCEVRLINVKQRGQVPKGQWLSKSLLPERLVASLDRKALAFLR